MSHPMKILSAPVAKRGAAVVLLLCLLLSFCGCKRKEEAGAPAFLLSEAEDTWIPVIETPSVYASYTAKTKTITDIRSKYAILIDVDRNEVVASLNGDARIFPASMTKIMTLIVAAEHIPNPAETMYTFSYKITDPPYQAGASTAGFSSGECVSMLDIFYGVALPSGADATGAIADYVSGSEEAFAELMNEKAAQIGLSDTHFVNASGLHDAKHYSTPHEIAVLMEYAMNHPVLAPILSAYQYTTTPTPEHPEGIQLTSTLFSKMRGDEPQVCEVIAGKTGYTLEAQNCLATYAETASGHRYVLVTASGADSATGSYAAVYDAIDIYKRYVPAE